jgi:hypothetical protein
MAQSFSRLSAEMIDKPKNQTDDDADNQGRGERKIESPMFAAITDVARQAPQTKWEFWTEIQQSTNDDEERPKREENATELLRGFHR